MTKPNAHSLQLHKGLVAEFHERDQVLWLGLPDKDLTCLLTPMEDIELYFFEENRQLLVSSSSNLFVPCSKKEAQTLAQLICAELVIDKPLSRKERARIEAMVNADFDEFLLRSSKTGA